MKFHILIIFVFLYLIGNAQSTYRIQFNNPEDDRFSNLIENSKDEIICIGTRNSNYIGYSDYKGLLYKITANGDTMSRTYRFADTAITFHSINENSDGSYLIIGTAFPPPYHDHLMMTMLLDSGFNYQSKRIFTFPDYTHFELYHTLVDTDGYYVLGTISNKYTYGYLDHLFCKLGFNGDTLYTKLYSGSPDPLYFDDVLFNQDSTEIWIVGYGYNDEFYPSKLVLDTRFNIKSLNLLPDPYQLRKPINMRWLSDSTLLLMGRYDLWTMTGISEDQIGISIIDTSFSYSPVSYYGYDETNDYPAYTDCYDFRNNDSIFIMGTIDIGGEFWPTQNSSIVFGHLDKELNTRVLRYFGGDSYYMAHSIHVCKDGGVLMTATSYNDEINDWGNDIVFWKVDKNGLITGTSNQEISRSEPTLFPNPGNGVVYIDCAKEATIAEFMDITGSLVLRVTLNSEIKQINTRSLKPGIYLCIIKFSDGSVKTTKWVKQ